MVVVCYSLLAVASVVQLVQSAGGWAVKGSSLTRSTRPLPVGPSMGDITLSATSSGGTGTKTTFMAADDPADIYKTFSTGRGFPARSVPADDVGSGAVSLSTTVPASGSATLTLVFAWHFPDRDFTHQILGNMYTEIWPDSAAVVAELATEAKLTSVVADINAHHYAGPLV